MSGNVDLNSETMIIDARQAFMEKNPVSPSLCQIAAETIPNPDERAALAKMAEISRNVALEAEVKRLADRARNAECQMHALMRS